MAAQAIAGKSGAVKVTGTPDQTVGLITDWSIDINRENYDSTALGDDFKSSVIGLAEWSGRCSGYFDVEDDVGQTLLQNAVLTGVALTMEFHIDNSASIFVGKVNPGQVSVGNPVGGLVSFEFSFQGTGQLLFS
jgi:hypothetical protein